jgi:amidase
MHVDVASESPTGRAMETEPPYTIPADYVINEFTPTMPARWHVPPGAELEVICVDGSGGVIRTEEDLVPFVPVEAANDATGPISVDGARPGDVLRFSIHSIEVLADRGWTVLIPDFGLHGPSVSRPSTRFSSITGSSVTVLGRFELPLRPMLGTIGVAPRAGDWNTITPHDHGGNMDTADVRAGARILLPVSQDGALLAMGDAKALMGDGEVCSTGIEVPVKVRGRVEVLRGRSIARPMVETDREWMTIGSAESYIEAFRLANGDMVNLLMDAQGLSWEEAYMLTSVVSDLRISQVVNPLVTVRCCLSKHYVQGVFDGLELVAG